MAGNQNQTFFAEGKGSSRLSDDDRVWEGLVFLCLAQIESPLLKILRISSVGFIGFWIFECFHIPRYLEDKTQV